MYKRSTIMLRIVYYILFVVVAVVKSQTWTEVTSSAGWSARRGHRSFVHNSKIFVIGGDDGSVKEMYGPRLMMVRLGWK